MSKPDETGEAEQSASPFVVHRVADRFSVVTSFGILCHNVSRSAATAAIVEAGADPAILDTPADPIVFRSTFMAATASELEAISATLETLPQSADVEDLKSKQLAVSASVNKLSSEIREEKRVRELVQLEAQHARAVETMFAQWPASYRNEPRYVALVYSTLRNSKLGRRIKELRDEIQS